MSARASSSGQSTRSALRSRQRVDLGTGEEAVDLVVQRAFVRDELPRELASAFEQLTVGSQAREAKLGETGLARSEQLALAAELQVLLGQFEAVGRVDKSLQAFTGVVGQLYLCS